MTLPEYKATILGVKGKLYSTIEMARALGITKRTLYRWLYDGFLPEPARISIGGSTVRVWSEGELKKARTIAGKRKHTAILQRLLETWPQIRSAHSLQFKFSGSIHTFGLSTVNEEILTIAELAARLKVPKSWVYEQTRKRAGVRHTPLPCKKVGKYLRFYWSEVHSWVEEMNRGRG